MQFVLIILLVLFVLVGLPLIKGYLRLRRYQQELQKKMEEAMRGGQRGQAGQTGQQRKPTYNKTVAEDAHYEDIPGAKPDDPADSAPENIPDDPIIEDAKYEEID